MIQISRRVVRDALAFPEWGVSQRRLSFAWPSAATDRRRVCINSQTRIDIHALPGLRVVMPSTALTSRALRTTIRCDDLGDVLEHKQLYRQPYQPRSIPGPILRCSVRARPAS